MADVIGTKFELCFNDFVTPLKTAIGIPTPTEHTVSDPELQAMMIRTLGAIFHSVSECKNIDKFKPTVVEITAHLAQLLSAGLPDSDGRDEAVKETLSLSAGFLKHEFAQFMPVLMAPLLRDAQLDVDFKLVDADTPVAADPNKVSFNIKIRGVGTKQASMNTYALMSKGGAFVVLEKISDNMGKAFAPYVEQNTEFLKIVATHMTYKEKKAIRKSAMKIFKNILASIGYPKNKDLFQESIQMFMTEF